MRAVIEPESAGDLRELELRRHLQMMARSVERAESGICLTMILRSATSDPARALVAMKGALQRAGVRARAILARLDRDEELRQLCTSLSDLAPQVPAHELIRWARNPRLLDAHEQVIYGTSMSWSGDAMRREADRRNALNLFDEDAPDTVRLGRLAFAALWTASSPVPERYFNGSFATRPHGAYEQAVEQPVSASPSVPGPQGWPLLRH
jgi:hypothetical protein